MLHTPVILSLKNEGYVFYTCRPKIESRIRFLVGGIAVRDVGDEDVGGVTTTKRAINIT